MREGALLLMRATCALDLHQTVEHLVRKYLARFGLDWANVSVG